MKIGKFRIVIVKELKKYDSGVFFQTNQEIKNWELVTIRKVLKLLEN